VPIIAPVSQRQILGWIANIVRAPRYSPPHPPQVEHRRFAFEPAARAWIEAERKQWSSSANELAGFGASLVPEYAGCM
jgi:hypothetical protein